MGQIDVHSSPRYKTTTMFLHCSLLTARLTKTAPAAQDFLSYKLSPFWTETLISLSPRKVLVLAASDL